MGRRYKTKNRGRHGEKGWLSGLYKKEEKVEKKVENIKEGIIVQDQELKYNQPEPHSKICTNCKGQWIY